MSRNRGWFRFYDRMIDSPQVLELDDAEFRLLVSVWCLASASEQRGMLPFTARALQRRALPDHSTQDVEAMLAHLVALDLLQPLDDGRVYAVARWDQHQYEHPSWAPEARRQQKINERQAQREESQARRNDVASGRNRDLEREPDVSPRNPVQDFGPPTAAAAAATSDPPAAAPPPRSAPLRVASAENPGVPLPDGNQAQAAEAASPAKPAPAPPKPKLIYADDSPAMQLARSLGAGIHRHKPDAKLPRGDGWQAWAREFDLALRIDHRPREKIEAVIAYAMRSSFWRGVIFSARKLREKFDVLDSQRLEDANGDRRQTANGQSGGYTGNAGNGRSSRGNGGGGYTGQRLPTQDEYRAYARRIGQHIPGDDDEGADDRDGDEGAGERDETRRDAECDGTDPEFHARAARAAG